MIPRILSGLALFMVLASCSEKQELLENNNPGRYMLEKDVLWTEVDGFPLTMDIYTPRTGREDYPVLVMFHGGGWLINDNSIMDQPAAYIATHGEYVVCNVNYRLLGDQGNTVTMNQIVEDAFGAVLWVKDNIGAYQGDPSKVAVTGDSAGGHLSAMIVNRGKDLSSTPFIESLAFKPSYLPPGKTAEDVAAEDGMAVQAAVLSYGAFDLLAEAQGDFESITNPFWLMGGAMPRGMFGEPYTAENNPELYRAVSPVYHLPADESRQLPPQLLTVGSEDTLITPESIKDYMAKLQATGQDARYWEYEGRTHAFLDSGSNPVLGSSFEADAPQALDVMIEFLDSVFYP